MIGTAALDVLRSANFALLWTAQVISGFGDRITVVALAYVTWVRTGSALSTALAVVIASLPHAVFGFFGGALADSLGHRRAMIMADLGRVAAIASIPVVLTLNAPLWIVYALVVVATLCATVFNPARLAIVPDLVPAARLASSNSLIYASDRTVEIVGVLVAGAVVAILGEGAFFLDAATFAVSALLLKLIDRPDRSMHPLSWSGLFAEAADGLRVLGQNAVLRANTLFSLPAQLALPVMNGLTPVLVFREYGMGAPEFAATEAAIAIGAVVAGVAYPGVAAGMRKGRLIIGGFLLYGLAVLGVGISPGLPVTLGILVVLGAANVLFFVSNVTLSQEATPPALRARVFGSRSALLNVTWLPVILATGALAESFPVQALLVVAGVFTVAVALVGALLPGIRDVS